MIPKRYITQWQHEVPWTSELQVEQDLLISRVLVELYTNKEISESLAFRGGTALNKLFIQPPARYSEDIDLVQLRAEPIGKSINTIQDLLNPWLAKPTVKRWQGRATLVYRFESEDDLKLPARLKIEINTNEHFNCRGIIKKVLKVESGWFAGQAEIPTYQLNELAATKLRALYQRKKGRDLFDMNLLLCHPDVDAKEVVDILTMYLKHENQLITRAMFEANLFEKINNVMFVKDTQPLLAHGVLWDIQEAYNNVKNKLVSLFPGMPWKGAS